MLNNYGEMLPKVAPEKIFEDMRKIKILYIYK